MGGDEDLSSTACAGRSSSAGPRARSCKQLCDSPLPSKHLTAREGGSWKKKEGTISAGRPAAISPHTRGRRTKSSSPATSTGRAGLGDRASEPPGGGRPYRFPARPYFLCGRKPAWSAGDQSHAPSLIGRPGRWTVSYPIYSRGCDTHFPVLLLQQPCWGAHRSSSAVQPISSLSLSISESTFRKYFLHRKPTGQLPCFCLGHAVCF